MGYKIKIVQSVKKTFSLLFVGFKKTSKVTGFGLKKIVTVIALGVKITVTIASFGFQKFFNIALISFMKTVTLAFVGFKTTVMLTFVGFKTTVMLAFVGFQKTFNIALAGVSFVEAKDAFVTASNPNLPPLERGVAAVKGTCCTGAVLTSFIATKTPPPISDACRYCCVICSYGYVLTGGNAAKGISYIYNSKGGKY